mgnify:CR=1 FL=1
MLLLLSPAKTLDFSEPALELHEQPRMLEDSKALVKVLRRQSESDLMKLMNISEDLAAVNRERYQDFETPFDLSNAKQSLLAFKGDVYLGLGAEDFNRKDLQFAQQQLRILSGLYGLLRPLDLMQPYRLEMGTKLKNERGKNLYEYWGDRITGLLNEDLNANGQDKSVVNLASKEYFSAVDPKKLDGALYQVDFKEHRDGKYKIIAVYAKKARGMMARYAVKNRVTTPEGLKAFDQAGYAFNAELSAEQHFVFTRES